MLKDFSEEVLMIISSFLIGKSEGLKFKHNRKFVELKRMFKIDYTPYRFLSGERFGKGIYFIIMFYGCQG